MDQYVLPVVFLAAVFVLFALLNRNRNSACAGCSGDCDESRCEKRA